MVVVKLNHKSPTLYDNYMKWRRIDRDLKIQIGAKIIHTTRRRREPEEKGCMTGTCKKGFNRDRMVSVEIQFGPEW